MTFPRAITLLSCLVVSVLLLPVEARADTELLLSKQPKYSLAFTGLVGVAGRSSYPGSSDMELQPDIKFGFLSFRSDKLNFGRTENASGDPYARPVGWATGVSFGNMSSRKASDYPELAGLENVPTSIEAGVGIGYVFPNAELLATARYGVIGHNSWVGGLRAFYVTRPMDRLAVRFGPRIEFGSDSYARTYFGVTPAEASNSAFSAYSPSGGLISAGLELIATYEVSDDWWLELGARWDRIDGDAADSPIVLQGSRDQAAIRLGIRRAFSLRF